MDADQVRSKQRVTDHGEVFTADHQVRAMCDLVADECVRIDSRFLEPACGDGNFLAEILTRKLDVTARRYQKSPYDYERNALLALGSLYGVELLHDNVVLCRERLFRVWEARYRKAVRKKDRSGEVLESARYILEKNIICGDALSLHRVDAEGLSTREPIVFSQWAFATGPMMKREDYTFEELLRRGEAESEDAAEREQMSLGLPAPARDQDGEGTLIRAYPPVHYRRLKDYG